MLFPTALSESPVFTKKPIRLALRAAALGLGCFSVSMAQANEGSEAAQALAPITVTSTRSAEVEPDPELEYLGKSGRSANGLALSIKETPQSVTVFTEKRIEDQQLNTIDKVLNQTAGVSSKEYDSARQYYYARGFEITNFMINGTQLMFDPGWGTGEQDLSTDMYEQIEVVKGATGLMSGNGNPSASINMVRKRANKTEFEGKASAGLTERHGLSTSMDVAGGLNDDGSVRGRLVFSHDQEDSFRDVADQARSMIFATTEIDLSERTLLTMGGSYQEIANNGSTWGGLPLWYSDGTRTNWDRSKTTAADWTYWDSTHANVFAELSHTLTNQWQVNARLNYGQSTGDSRLLYVYGTPDRTTGLGLSPWTGGKYDMDTQYYMADLFAQGQFGLLDREHDVTFGVSHAERRFTAHNNSVTATSPLGDFNAWNGTGYPLFTYGARTLYEEYTDTETALYGATRLNLHDNFKVITGVRYSQFDKEITPGGVKIQAGDNISHDGIVTPYVGVLYDLSRQVTAYASYTDIFNTQGERDRNGKLLDPVTGESYEIGLKAGFWDDRLTASAAVFKITQDNLAQADSGQTVPGTPDQAYYAAEGATSEGYELELAGAITPQWDIQLGWTAYQAKDAANNKVNTDQPRQLLKAFTTYRLSGELNQWTLGGGVVWQSESYATATNSVTGLKERVEQDSYALVNLMAKYQVSPELALQLNIDNLTDETYYTNIGTFGQIAYGTPRTVSVSANYRF